MELLNCHSRRETPCRANTLRGEGLIQVFLDLTKAYDTVDRERLFLLLKDCGMGPRCLTVLQATWEGSLLVPKKGGRYGNHIYTSRGVRQGDIISPTLFNIIVDAILRYERSVINRDRQGLGQNQFTNVRFYADDGAIAGTDAAAVQHSLDSVIEGFARMGIKVNRRKTKWMYVCGEKWVNCIQHGVYCNLVQGSTDSYVDQGRQQIKCPCVTNACNDGVSNDTYCMLIESG